MKPCQPLQFSTLSAPSHILYKILLPFVLLNSGCSHKPRRPKTRLFSNSLPKREARITIVRAPVKLDRIRAFRRREDHHPSQEEGQKDNREVQSRWFQKMHPPVMLSAKQSSSARKTKREESPQTAEVDCEPVVPTRIPPFLTQPLSDIQTKFQDLVWMERNRLAQGALSESPDHQFAILQEPSKHLDRYTNILPFNNNRVRLQVPEGHNDYINASPIILNSRKTSTNTRYIAMQGPKEASSNHVWRMIWNELESPVVIVMLTETHEAGQEKCFQYYPKRVDSPPLIIGERDEFGDGFKATVTCIEEESTAEGSAIEVRKFTMCLEGKEDQKIIYHLLYTKWPDFGAPSGEDLDSFFKLMELSREKNNNPNNPRIIHCSAGVGRSGTFIALEHLMSELQVGALNPKDGQDAADDDPVFSTVNTLREQRKSMVQSETQYFFIYKVLRRLWEQNHPDTVRSGEMSYGEPTAKVAKRHETDDVFS